MAVSNDNYDEPMKIVAYYRWQGDSTEHLTPDKIDASLCTHLIVGFSTVNNSLLVHDSDDNIKGYKWAATLKEKNAELKVMLSIGGGSGFSQAVSSCENREKFINSIITFLRENDLDGVDIDWEFPVWAFPIWKRGPKQDKSNLTQLLKEFKTAAHHECPENPLLISVAVAAPKPIIDVAYDIPGLSQYADFVNLMSYGYNNFKWYQPFTAHNSPLFSRRSDIAYFRTLNTAWSAEYWIKKGLSKSKLMVGVPLYSNGYRLISSNRHNVGTLAKGETYGRTYPQILEMLRKNAVRVFDEEAKVPYIYDGDYWMSYDDCQSVKIKSEWIKSQGYGGVMTFSLNTDDWEGVNDEKITFPLMRTIKTMISS